MTSFQKVLASLIQLLAMSSGRDKVNIKIFRLADLFNIFVNILLENTLCNIN